MEIAAFGFVVVMLGIAYIVFRVLKKTVKLAIRAIVLMIIIAVAIIGGLALWFSGAGDTAVSLLLFTG